MFTPHRVQRQQNAGAYRHTHVHLGPPRTTFTTPPVACSVCVADFVKPSSAAALAVAFTVGPTGSATIVTRPTALLPLPRQ